MGEHKFNNGATKYGADMGRRAFHAEKRDHIGDRLSLARVRLDIGGYDNGGAYWGTGEPLWRVSCDETKATHETIEFFLRAPSRDAAKERVRGTFGYSSARFFR